MSFYEICFLRAPCCLAGDEGAGREGAEYGEWQCAFACTKAHDVVYDKIQRFLSFLLDLRSLDPLGEGESENIDIQRYNECVSDGCAEIQDARVARASTDDFNGLFPLFFSLLTRYFCFVRCGGRGSAVNRVILQSNNKNEDLSSQSSKIDAMSSCWNYA